MKLDDLQEQHVRKWIEEGLQPAAIQERLASEFGLTLTYMEVRFLLDDLKVQPRDKEPLPSSILGSQPGDAGQAPAGSGGASGMPGLDPGAEGLTGSGVAVSVDQVTRPGSVASGKVTFSDGKRAEWYLDQMGRLGLAPMEKGYRPSQTDLAAFQTELQTELARLGY
jgi:hypothetical protein